MSMSPLTNCGGTADYRSAELAADARSLAANVSNDRIGPYRLLEVVGEGGFGIVWLGERREPMVQRVALKVLKPGMDSRSVIARFEQERQALALMDHPNIAKIFDGGVTDRGLPYFVMEYVPGVPITKYCEVHRLDLRRRVELFAKACAAAQHAHFKAVIHRDLKPSNILVAETDSEPVLKVIDFGIAKALSSRLIEQTIHTERGVVIGTPEYMSPEQADFGHADVDTRTDVYSLGVVLYELLCGQVPILSESLRGKSLAELGRLIRETEPPSLADQVWRLSKLGSADGSLKWHQRFGEHSAAALKRMVRGDLQRIVERAMAKDRKDRYQSPGELASDLDGWLNGRRVKAPPSNSITIRQAVTTAPYALPVFGLVAMGLLSGVLLSASFRPSGVSQEARYYYSLTAGALLSWPTVAMSVFQSVRLGAKRSISLRWAATVAAILLLLSTMIRLAVPYWAGVSPLSPGPLWGLTRSTVDLAALFCVSTAALMVWPRLRIGQAAKSAASILLFATFWGIIVVAEVALAAVLANLTFGVPSH